MSIAKLNEDYLFNQKEDCSNITIGSKSTKNALIKIKNSEINNQNASNGFSKSDSITGFNIKLKKNTENNHALKHERIAVIKGKNTENNALNNNVDFYDNDSLSQMVRKSPNNFYGNFENLISEDDNTFSFESFNNKNQQDFQGLESKNIFSENTSVIAEDNFSSNLINNNVNYNSTMCNLNSKNKQSLKNELKAKNNSNAFTENQDFKKSNLLNLKVNNNNNNFNTNNNFSSNNNYNNKNTNDKSDKTFCNYTYTLIENNKQNNSNSCNLIRNKSNNINYCSNEENASFNSLLDSNFNCNFNSKSINQNKKQNKKKFNYCEAKKTGKWSDEEDRILYELVPLYGPKNWKKIADKIQGRSAIQCLHRWTKILQPGLVKGPWTIEEDRKLLDWVKKEGAMKWTQCSEFIKGRNGKQCRERWFHTLNPKIIKGNWTAEEDLRIFTLYKQLGGKWSKIALSILGRTENSIKNRFYSTLRRKAVEQAKSRSNAKQHSDLSSSSAENVNCAEFAYDSYKAKKANQISNLGSNFSLDELSDFLPQALLEVKIKFMKEFNFTPEELARKENEILHGEVSREQKLNADYLKEKLNEENVLNMQGNFVYNNDNNLAGNPQTINLNLNFNSNHNNFIVGNEKIINTQNPEIINSTNNNNFNNPPNAVLLNQNNVLADFNQNNIFKERIPNFKEEININNNFNNNQDNQFKFDFLNQGNDYKNMDMFTLENNIIDFCDNPNFMYSDNNFSFLDTQVDHIIDSMFLNNNIIMTNDNEKDCDMCFVNNDNNANKNNNNNNNYIKKQENIFAADANKNLNAESLLSNRNEISYNQTANHNQEQKRIKDQNSSLTTNTFKSVLAQNQTKNRIEILPKIKSNVELDSVAKVEEKSNTQQPIKKHVLSSLISQLEDLERLVKNTKKELIKYNEKGDVEAAASEEAILSTVNLTNTIQKLFK